MGLGIITRRGKAPRKMKEKYKVLASLQSTGEQYVNIGYYSNPYTSVEISLSVMGYVTDNWNGLFGSRTSQTGTDSFACFVNKSTGNLAFNFAGTDSSEISGTSVSGIRNIRNDGKVFYQNNKAIYTFSGTLSPSNYGWYLFACNLAGMTRFSKQKFDFCKIYENGTLMKDLIPVKDIDTNELGILDRISLMFYPNSGTGEFIEGAETGEVIMAYAA